MRASAAVKGDGAGVPPPAGSASGPAAAADAHGAGAGATAPECSRADAVAGDASSRCAPGRAERADSTAASDGDVGEPDARDAAAGREPVSGPRSEVAVSQRGVRGRANSYRAAAAVAGRGAAVAADVRRPPAGRSPAGRATLVRL
jgi:hypothetical protein